VAGFQAGFQDGGYLHACAFALEVLGAEALNPSSKQEYSGADRCCICGGEADRFGKPWARKHAINESYGPLNSFAEPGSPAVCGACAYFAVGRTFADQVTRRGLTVKLWPQASWRSYSHLFSQRDGYVIGNKDAWRAFLANPPEPPFLAVLTTTGKKNILYRSTVAHSRDLFPVLVEEDVTWVERAVFQDVLKDFEAAYTSGFSKDSILSGDYSQAAVLALGIAAWRALEAPLAVHRAQRLPMLRLAHFVATRPQQPNHKETN
jgi:CRISPR type IV-associated protein Csf1